MLKAINIWKNYGFVEPDLEEDTIINQVTLILKLNAVDNINKSNDMKMSEKQEQEEKNERRLSEDTKNERRLSEVLSEVLNKNDYKKVEKIVSYLEENKTITSNIAENITGKSGATVRRYLRLLVETGYVKAEGKTSNTRYIV